MSFGITVQNFDGRVTLDETYPHIYPRTTITVNGGAAYPGTGHQSGDLVFANSYNDGYIAMGALSPGGAASYMTTSQGTNRFPVSFGYFIYFASKMAGNIVTAGSGYGIEVYDSSSQLVYTTDLSQTFRVVASGSFAGAAQNQPATELSFPSAIGEFEDLTKIYVLLNNTQHFRLNDPVFEEFESIIGYRFEYTTGTYIEPGKRGRVHVCNQAYWASEDAFLGIGGRSLDYLIVELI